MEKKLPFHLFPDGNILIYYGLIGLTLSFITTALVIPFVIKLVVKNKVCDTPNERSSHKYTTPTLGGIGFYISLLVGLFWIFMVDNDQNIYYLLPALTVLCFAGIYDDVFLLSARKKILAQLFAIFFIVISLDFPILNLHGFMGVNTTPFYLGIFLVTLFFLIVINAINLIDGIDGLAGLIGVVTLSIFAIFFYLNGKNANFMISLVLIGSLVSFLMFNLSRNKKIFMGDTGSMILGFIIAYQAINFLSFTDYEFNSLGILPENVIYILISILFIPLIDLLRVFMMRLAVGKNPFKADRNHMHHVLLDTGFSHIQSSVIMTCLGLVVFTFVQIANLNSKINLFFFLIFISLAVIQLFHFMKYGPVKLISYKFLITFIQNGLSYILRIVKNSSSYVFRSFF